MTHVCYEVIFPDGTWWLGVSRKSAVEKREQILRWWKSATGHSNLHPVVAEKLVRHRNRFRFNVLLKGDLEDCHSYRERLAASAHDDPLCLVRTRYRPGEIRTCRICGETKDGSRFYRQTAGYPRTECITCSRVIQKEQKARREG